MLDEKFKSRMKDILGNEYGAFIDAVENSPETRAVRVNTVKASPKALFDSGVFDITPLPYAADGFSLLGGEGIGNTPEHHAGILYVQDAGAMATANALDIKAGWRVLDMCAAPGGKSGQAAAKIGEAGFLLSNEYVPKRAKTVVSNFERLGVKNAIVTSLDTDEFKKLFRDYFDLVIADVPCSGEGMFRKSEEAIEEWSEENVSRCAKRQKTIINNAAPLVRGGGYLLYSTCTYSPEENEAVVDGFLREHPDFTLVEVKESLKSVTRDGINFDGAYSKNLHMARRFYPHVFDGEGQFIALMQKAADTDTDRKILYKDASFPLTKKEDAVILRFFSENLTEIPRGKLRRVGENLVILPHGMPVPPKSVFCAGVLLGEIKGENFFPSHHFFSAYGRLFKRKEELSRHDVRAEKYLRGEEIDAKSFTDGGWCAIIYEGAALGGGKASSGKIKNHYPKGLRLKG